MGRNRVEWTSERRSSHAEATRRGIEDRRSRLAVRPRDLDRLRREGLVAEPLRPLVVLAEREYEELIIQLGGPDEVPPTRRMLCEDTVSLGIATRAELGRFLRTADPAALERVATLANSRRANLIAIGLERRAAKVRDFATYFIEDQDTDTTDQSGRQSPDGDS